MLVKLNKVDKKGRELYKNALSGRVAPLSMQDFHPSQRRENRHPEQFKQKPNIFQRTLRRAKKYGKTNIAKILALFIEKKNKKQL